MNKALQRAVLAVASVLLFSLLVVLCEFTSAQFTTRPADLTTVHGRLNHIWPPNGAREHREWIQANPRFSEPYVTRYNGQSWVEDYDVLIERPADTYRVFYLGDSFTEGCVPMEQSVPSQVEKALRATLAQCGKRLEVINTGTSSYSPILYYILTRYYLESYSPDLLVVNVDMTDDYDDWKYRQNLILAEDGTPWGAPSRNIYQSPTIESADGNQLRASWFMRSQLFLYQYSYTYQLVQQLGAGRENTPATRRQSSSGQDWRALHQQGIYTRWSWVRSSWDDFTKRNVDATLQTLRQLVHFAQQRGISIALSSVPHFQQYPNTEGKRRWSIRPHQEIEALSRAAAVPYIDSYRALMEVIAGTEQNRFYYSGDMHFNPDGYRHWAKSHIEAFLNPEMQLLPPECYVGS